MENLNSELDLYLWFEKKWGYKLSSSDITYITKTLWPLIEKNNRNSDGWIDMDEYARRHPSIDPEDPYGGQHG